MREGNDQRRWLVTGAGGMLGRDVVTRLTGQGLAVTAATSRDLDVRDGGACLDGVSAHDVVVNCAAWTAVDDAETEEAAAFAVNAVGPANLARACARAEHRDALVVRTAWLYGRHGRCFPRTIAAVLGQRDGVDVVTDQVGQPTWPADVARVLVDLVEAAAPPGTYHATAAGSASWHAFASAVAAATGRGADVVHETTSDRFVRPASRPAYSVLGHGALLAADVEPIGHWADRFALAAPSVLSDLG